MEKLTEKMQILETESSLIEGFEPSSQEKHHYIRGKFATIETINSNGRIYPRHLWEREVARYQEEIKNGTINTLMEWDHPKDRLEVDPSKAIAKITKLWIEGNYVMGEAIIFDVPMAETLKSLIKYGVQLSVSSRARGRTNAQGVVQEFELITFDFVAKPSDTAATMYGIFENFNEGNMMNDELLESMVNMVRTKDIEIQDLKKEVDIWKAKLLESGDSGDFDNSNIEELNEEIEVWRQRYIDAVTMSSLSESDIGRKYWSRDGEDPMNDRQYIGDYVTDIVDDYGDIDEPEDFKPKVSRKQRGLRDVNQTDSKYIRRNRQQLNENFVEFLSGLLWVDGPQYDELGDIIDGTYLVSLDLIVEDIEMVAFIDITIKGNSIFNARFVGAENTRGSSISVPNNIKTDIIKRTKNTRITDIDY